MTTRAEQLAELRERRTLLEAALRDSYRGAAWSGAGVSLTRQAPEDLRREIQVVGRQIRKLEGAELGERPTLGAAYRARTPGA